MKRTFVLDTNALIYNSQAIYKFGNNNVVLPFVVLEEVDGLKTREGLTGASARQVNRELEKIRNLALEQGSTLSQGVDLPTGGRFQIWSSKVEVKSPLDSKKADNIIITTALEVQRMRPDEKVTLISKDINVRIKCDSIGIEAEDFFDTVQVDRLYSGIVETQYLSKESLDDLYSDKALDVCDDLEEEVLNSLSENEYGRISAHQGNTNALVKYVSEGEGQNKRWSAEIVGKQRAWKIEGRDSEQKYALDALLDPSVSLVTISGAAGTGKTLLALAAALEQTNLFPNEKREKKYREEDDGPGSSYPYRRIIMSRPLEPFHKEIGFLPGSIEDKMDPWLAPVWDNLEFLFRGEDGKKTIDMLREQGIFEIRALTHLRGSSIRDAFIIVDEAQNLNQHEMKTIITRAGHNSKLILIGDVEQIDNQHLDRRNSGLSVVAELFRDSKIAAHITLTKGQRSKLATLAVERFQ